ncbi:MAG TPA: hypothetical protein VFC00_30645 [Micromonosporaceae bacterium]|nr:hypothetical protein [Micromonosporaceae bacterium]
MSRQPTVKSVVQSDIDELGDLIGIEPSLAATALKLAEAIDTGGGEDGRMLPALTRELRITLKALFDARGADEDDDDAGLATPA